jgi:hypothetical protein
MWSTKYFGAFVSLFVSIILTPFPVWRVAHTMNGKTNLGAAPFGVWFFKGCGFRVNFIANIGQEENLRPLDFAQDNPVEPADAEGLS